MKIIRKSNFRIIVEPKRLGDYGSIRVSDNFWNEKPERIEKNYIDRCEDMIAQIKRHVDTVDSAIIDFDTEELCSHCGYSWEVDENGVPICCDKAIEEHKIYLLTTKTPI